MYQARHGDLFIESVKELPKKLKKAKDNVIIAGLSSGHNHTLEGKAKIYKSGDKTFIEVTGKANLNHEEHGKIDLPKGIYQAITQVEFDVYQGLREVVD